MSNATIDKALAFIDEGKVKMLSPSEAGTVRGSVDSTATYIVEIGTEEWSCTCPFGQMKQNRTTNDVCSHVQAVAMQSGEML